MIANELQKIVGTKLEHPENENWGDYAVFVKPGAEADEVIKKLRELEFVESVARTGGFVNIKLKDAYFSNLIARVITDSEWGKSSMFGDKRVMIEFTDPNPFKELHIGHLYSNTVGEAISRLFEANGAVVKRACYQGDVGMHVAKAIWGMMRLKLGKNVTAKSLGEAYAAGATAFEDNSEAAAEIKELNIKLYEAKSAEIMKLYELGKRESLMYFDGIYKRLGTKFDFMYFESESGKKGMQVVEEGLGKGVFKKSEGAVVFEGEKYGLHTRVFVNSQGLPTYEAKELGLAPTKFADFPYDLSVIITANEINDYFRVLLKCLDLLYPDLAKRTKHIGHGMVKLPGMAKMASRKGNVLTAEWLLDEAKKKVLEIAPDATDPDAVGVAAVKYAMLRSGIGRDIEFDIDKSVSFEGSSGPYIQYTFARTQSVLARAKGQGLGAKFDLALSTKHLALNEEELR
ncbi:MAG: arginine--tRNA ligase, partial [Patescibacteria group bacterium]